MPIETTRDFVLRSRLERNEACGGDDGETGRAASFGATPRQFARHGFMAARGFVAKFWPKERRSRSAARAMTTLTWLAGLGICVSVGLTAMLYFTQRSLMYFPDQAHVTPAQAGLPQATEVTLTTADGEH